MTPEVEAFISSFGDTRDRIEATLTALPPRLRDEPFLGHWSPRDVLAHLIGWDRTNVEAIDEITAGRRPGFYDAYDEDWTSFNSLLVAACSSDDWQAMLADVRASRRAFVSKLRALPSLEPVGGGALKWRGRRVTLRGLLRAVLHDEAEHLGQLEALAASRPEGRR